MSSPAVRVALFAGAREIAGTDFIEIESADRLTADQVCQHLAQVCPGLQGLMGACRLAVDNVYVDGKSLVDPSSDVALIPPVSGG